MTTLLASAPAVNGLTRNHPVPANLVVNGQAVTQRDWDEFFAWMFTPAPDGMGLEAAVDEEGIDAGAETLAEEYATFRDDHPATTPAPTPSAKPANPLPIGTATDLTDADVNAEFDNATGKLDNDKDKAKDDKVIADIVEMIRSKLSVEGKRNFAIGKRAFEHAQWQRSKFPAYTSGDFDKMVLRIRTEVRLFVPIKPESIQIAKWVKCHYMRELVRSEDGDSVAESICMAEYLAIAGQGCDFSTKTLDGTLNPGWLNFIRSVARDRAANPDSVRREDFANRVKATVKMLADQKAATDPVKAATQAASNAIKAKNAAVAKTTKAISSAVNDGIVSGAISPEGALAIVEDVAKHHGKPLKAASVGFDPVNCTVADCDVLIAAMYAANKPDELRRLGEKASAAYAQMVAASTAASKAGDAAAVAKGG